MSARQPWLRNLAALADIVAAGAVIVSLVYFGRELRANTDATEGATYQQMIDASDRYLLAEATDSSLNALVTRAREHPDSLSHEEQLRYYWFQRVFWRNMENAFVQHRRGVLADAEWATYHHLLCDAAGDPTWPYQRSAFSPAFVDLVKACPPLKKSDP